MFSFLSSISVSAPLVCVRAHVCACDMYASLHAYEEAGRLHGLTCLFLLLSTLSSEADALTESGTLYFGKDGWPSSPQDLLVSSPKLWGYKHTSPLLAFSMSSGDPNTGYYEPSPQSQFTF